MDDWRDRLAHEIHSRGVKLTKMSSALGFHRDYVSNVLSGKAKPSTDKLSMICEEIGVPLAKILTDPPAEETQEITSTVREDLNEKALKGVRDFISAGKYDLSSG